MPFPTIPTLPAFGEDTAPTLAELDAQAEESRQTADEALLDAQAADSGDLQPAQEELSAEQSADAAARAASQAADAAWRARWGDVTAEGKVETPPKKEGILGKFLKAITAGSAATSGAARYALGKGESSLWETVKKSVKEGQGYGDLLADLGIRSRWATIPLGLAGDILLDPITYVPFAGLAGVGTKIVRGGLKAGLTGAKLGTKAVAIETAAKALRPFAGRAAETLLKARQTASGLKKGAEALGEAAKALPVITGTDLASMGKWPKKFLEMSDRARIANEDWLKAVHGTEDAVEALSKEMARARGSLGYKLGEKIKSGAVGVTKRALMWTGMKADDAEKAARDLLIYDPARVGKERFAASETEELKAKATAAVKGHPTGETAVAASIGEPIGEALGRLQAGFGRGVDKFIDPDAFASVVRQVTQLDQMFNFADKSPVGLQEVAARLYSHLTPEEALLKARKFQSEVEPFMRTAQEKFGKDAVDMAARMFGQDSKSAKALAEWAEKGEYGRLLDYMSQLKTLRTGFVPYDKAMASFLTSKAGRSFFNATAVMNGLFRSAVLGANFPAGAAYQLFSNASMMSMNGLKAFTPETYRAFAKSFKFWRGKDMDLLNYFSLDNGIREAVSTHPGFFEGLFGYDARFLTDSKAFLRDKLDAFRKSSKFVRMSEPEQKLFVQELERQLAEVQKLGGVISISSPEAIASDPSVKRLLRSFKIDPEKVAQDLADKSLSPNLLNQDIMVGAFANFVRGIEVKSKSLGASPLWKGFHWYLTKPMQAFSWPDKISRMAAFIRMTDEGVDLDELTRLTSRFQLQSTDIVPTLYRKAEAGTKSLAGTPRYKVSAEKAGKIASEMFMDYSAMPGLVRMARSVPIAGIPFASFAAGMYHIAGSTVLHDPLFFRNVEMARREISRGATPAERNALISQYYAYLNSPDYLRVGSFNGNPYYMGIGQMLPYYSMSLLDGPDRRYKSETGQAISRWVDSDLFPFKDPIGQWIFDYLVLPAITREAIGRFGQPLWPKDASEPVKWLYAARGLAEPYVPKGLAYGAIPAGFASDLTPQQTEAIPNYSFRALYNAMKGRDTRGFMPSGQPEVARRVMQRLTKLLGIPVTNINKIYRAVTPVEEANQNE